MSEPTVTYTIRELLGRIEERLGKLEKQVAALDSTAATATAVRRAVWAAATSPLLAAGATWWITRR